jgi:hypothetical protein
MLFTYFALPSKSLSAIYVIQLTMTNFLNKSLYLTETDEGF